MTTQGSHLNNTNSELVKMMDNITAQKNEIEALIKEEEEQK